MYKNLRGFRSRRRGLIGSVQRRYLVFLRPALQIVYTLVIATTALISPALAH